MRKGLIVAVQRLTRSGKWSWFQDVFDIAQAESTGCYLISIMGSICRAIGESDQIEPPFSW